MSIYPLPGLYEPFNAISHLAAAGVFAVLSVQLIRRNRGDALRVALLSVFALASVLMLSTSGVYHMLAADGFASKILYRLDLAAIFVLIAGTFTSLHGLYFKGAARWIGLALMWIAALIGLTVTVIFLASIPDGVNTLVYVLLGWITGVSLIMTWRKHGWQDVRLIVCGGLAYSIGALLLELGWPTVIPGIMGPHEVWHIAVLIGLSLHWHFIWNLARRQRQEIVDT